MDTVSLTALAQDHLRLAREAHAGRSAVTVHGGHDRVLRQTVIALLEGRSLADHENPGEATLQVLTGRVVMAGSVGSTESADSVGSVGSVGSVELSAGELVVVPDARHRLDALEDSVVLLSVAARLT